MWPANLEKGGALEMNSTQTIISIMSIMSIIARVHIFCASGVAVLCTSAPVAS